MKNQEIAKILYEIADFLEMEGAQFKPYAYQKAALALETLEGDIEKIYKEGGRKALEKIPSVGKNISQQIEEYLKTGKVKYYQDLKEKTPVQMGELIAVEGIGPKKIKNLYQKLGIRNLKGLEKAARNHKIAPLFGFGEKTEKNILEGITFLKKSKGRFLLGEILPQVKEILERLKELKEVERINAAGSVRRMKETIGDVDILVTTKNPKKVMDFFVQLPGITKIWMKGPTKSSIRMEQGFDVDLRVVRKKSYGSALQYFTGSKEHNIVTRRIAIEKGLKLSEYGLFRGKKMIAGWNEAGVYKVLGLPWIEPEIRENQGEIEAALRQAQGKLNGLPKIIDYGDIKGDLHCHSNWADLNCRSDWDGGTGASSIEEMAKAAREMGYSYIGITDHTKFLRIEHGLNEKQLAKQRKEIDRLNSKLQITNSKQILNSKAELSDSWARREKRTKFSATFRILQGCEANILADGSIDIKDEALRKLDFVLAGVHSQLKMEKEKMTERIIRAMKNPNIDIIAHLTGRKIQRRDECQMDFDKILRAAKEFGVILEINGFPERLDLNAENIRRAKETDVKMVINSDAHHKDQLRFIELGIAQARRGWAEKEDIINTQPLEKLLKIFK